MKEIQIECPECKGTGLYVGACEQDGCAVVCIKCGGKGYTTFQYNDFRGKKVKEGVKRIFGKTFGIVHGPEDYKCKDGTVLRSMAALMKSGLTEKNPDLWKSLRVLTCTIIEV